jgi:hypothetical protein
MYYETILINLFSTVPGFLLNKNMNKNGGNLVLEYDKYYDHVILKLFVTVNCMYTMTACVKLLCTITVYNYSLLCTIAADGPLALPKW